MEKSYGQKLDVYYVATIIYLATLIAYVLITGTLIDETFEIVWQDPIVYLLGLCGIVSIGALIVALVLSKQVTIRENELVFSTRFKRRVIRPDEIRWVGFGRGSRGKVRSGIAEKAARIKLKERRRGLWLRPSVFDDSVGLMNDLREWCSKNDVLIRKRKKIGSPDSGSEKD